LRLRLLLAASVDKPAALASHLVRRGTTWHTGHGVFVQNGGAMAWYYWVLLIVVLWSVAKAFLWYIDRDRQLRHMKPSKRKYGEDNYV
jgi:hypothetical protein